MPRIQRTRARARRTSSLTLTGDPEAIAISCQQYIKRRAFKQLALRLGRDNAESIAADVWLWFTERRAKEPGFLSSRKAFREGVQRKLFDELRKAVRDLERWDEDVDVQDYVDASSGGGAPRLTVPDEIFAQSETIWHVQRAIAQLPRQMQRVIRLYDLKDWSADDVAAELGISPKTVRRIRHDAKERLRELLESFGGLKAA